MLEVHVKAATSQSSQPTSDTSTVNVAADTLSRAPINELETTTTLSLDYHKMAALQEDERITLLLQDFALKTFLYLAPTTRYCVMSPTTNCSQVPTSISLRHCS